jgi:hypothetical protein
MKTYSCLIRKLVAPGRTLNLGAFLPPLFPSPSLLRFPLYYGQPARLGVLGNSASCRPDCRVWHNQLSPHQAAAARGEDRSLALAAAAASVNER